MEKLLITGSDGLIGGVLRENLRDTYEIYGLDLKAYPNFAGIFRADITQPDEVEEVFARIPELAYVIHLAGNSRVDASWEAVLNVNIAGTQNVYAAALRHRVKRVVYASSNHATGAYEGFPPGLHLRKHHAQITSSDPLRPDGFYGVSKAAGEALARMYFEVHGMQSICLRIGSVLKDDDPRRDARTLSTWLSHRDLVHLVHRSLSADMPFGIYYGVSNNTNRFWDISDAARELGYRPEDDASEYAES